MTITIDLPAATEEKLRAHAAATGKKIEALVVEAVEANLSLSQISLRAMLSPVHEDFHKSGMTVQELDDLVQQSLTETRTVRKAALDRHA